MDYFSKVQMETRQKLRLPKSIWGRLAALLGALFAIFYVLGKVSTTVSTAGWYVSTYGFILWSLVFVLFVLVLKWMRKNLMWRLRNRLIVTYMFIGVIPVLLLVVMAGIASYLFVGQFATFIVTNDVTGELHRMEVANSMLVSDMASRVKSRGFSAPETVKALEAKLPANFPGRTITIWTGGNP
jgi:sigma-B regulation protein RsbU (phosphoserine phosphatase)